MVHSESSRALTAELNFKPAVMLATLGLSQARSHAPSGTVERRLVLLAQCLHISHAQSFAELLHKLTAA